MDDKLLINEIKKYDCFFNNESELFNNKKECRLAWHRISEKLNHSVRDCTNRWRNLRHRFVKTYERSKTKGEVEVAWDLYEDLMFLKDFIKSSGNDPLNNPEGSKSVKYLRSANRVIQQAPDEFDPEIIDEVKKHPLLYDKKDFSYFDKKARGKIWSDISDKLNIPGEKARKRWKVLRDHFVRDYNKVQSGDKPIVVWELYEKMMFLKDYIHTTILDQDFQPADLQEEEEDTLEPEALSNPTVLYTHLINEVKKYKCLLTATPDPTKRRKMAWMKISAKLNRPPLVLCKKWRYLRTRFIKEYLKHGENSDWELFENMLFLKAYTKKTEINKKSSEVFAEPSNKVEESDVILVEDCMSAPKEIKANLERNPFYVQLIQEVKKHEAIYNPMDENFKNTRYLGDIWDKICVTVDRPVTRCRARWKILRDRFIKEYVYYEKYGHFDEFRWEFFNDLLFLKDHIYLRRKVLFKEEENEDDPNPKPSRIVGKSLKETPLWSHAETLKFIEEIKKKTELYDPVYSKCNYQKARMTLWKQISQILNKPVSHCQVKWKTLRKRFIKESRRLAHYKKSGRKNATVGWPFFYKMLFLRPHLKIECLSYDKNYRIQLDDDCEENITEKEKDIEAEEGEEEDFEEDEEHFEELLEIEFNKEPSNEPEEIEAEEDLEEVLEEYDAVQKDTAANDDDDENYQCKEEEFYSQEFLYETEDDIESLNESEIISHIQREADFDNYEDNDENDDLVECEELSYEVPNIQFDVLENVSSHSVEEDFNERDQILEEDILMEIDDNLEDFDHQGLKEELDEDEFITLPLEKSKTLASSSLTKATSSIQNEDSSHLPFLSIVSSTLNQLTEDEQKDVKMFCLNYLTKKIKQNMENTIPPVD